MAENATLSASTAAPGQPPATTQAQTLADPTGKQPLYGESLLSSPLSGWVVPGVLSILVLFSIATWAALLIKSWQFGRFKRQNKRFIKRFWAAPDLATGAELAHKSPASLARLVQKGIGVITDTGASSAEKRLSQQINRGERLERHLAQQIQYERRGLENGLSLLASIGSTAPFIGLFGTVWGIMEALVHIGATGQASLDTVAGPIGHALIATGIGIAAAVPAVLIYNYFVRRLKLATADLEYFAEAFYGLVQEHNFVTTNPGSDTPVTPFTGHNVPRFAGNQA